MTFPTAFPLFPSSSQSGIKNKNLKIDHNNTEWYDINMGNPLNFPINVFFFFFFALWPNSQVHFILFVRRDCFSLTWKLTTGSENTNIYSKCLFASSTNLFATLTQNRILIPIQLWLKHSESASAFLFSWKRIAPCSWLHSDLSM